MSLPREILDQLLSGYMDDALSGEERARVEQLLRDDAEVARELEDLREIRSTLRSIRAADLESSLPSSFADRVLKSAVDQAATEGLGEEHPVMMLAQQPSTVVSNSQAMPWGKIAAVVAAVAASTIIAINIFGTPDKDPEQRGIAAVPQPSDPEVDPVPDVIPTPDVPDDPGTMVADADPKPEVNPPEVQTDIKVVQTPPNVVPKDPVVDPKLTPEQLAEIEADKLLRGLVMVVNVREAEPGAVSTLMDSASLKPINHEIDQDVVGFKQDLADFKDEGVKVFYIGSSAKKIDKFVNQLFVDEGIASVGLTLDVNRKTVQFAKHLRELDPTTVQHEVSWELTDDSGDSVRYLVDELSNRKFSPTPSTAGLLPKNSNDGTDFDSQLIVLVRPALTSDE